MALEYTILFGLLHYFIYIHPGDFHLRYLHVLPH